MSDNFLLPGGSYPFALIQLTLETLRNLFRIDRDVLWTLVRIVRGEQVSADKVFWDKLRAINFATLQNNIHNIVRDVTKSAVLGETDDLRIIDPTKQKVSPALPSATAVIGESKEDVVRLRPTEKARPTAAVASGGTPLYVALPPKDIDESGEPVVVLGIPMSLLRDAQEVQAGYEFTCPRCRNVHLLVDGVDLFEGADPGSVLKYECATRTLVGAIYGRFSVGLEDGMDYYNRALHIFEDILDVMQPFARRALQLESEIVEKGTITVGREHSMGMKVKISLVGFRRLLFAVTRIEKFLHDCEVSTEDWRSQVEAEATWNAKEATPAPPPTAPEEKGSTRSHVSMGQPQKEVFDNTVFGKPVSLKGGS